MAYIVNISDDRGYTRDDFVAALQGKQDKLYSGQNIKTVGGKVVLGSGNLDFSGQGGGQEYAYDLTDYEIGLKNGVLQKLAQLNPQGKYMTFGVISDTHTCPTKAEIDSLDDNEMQSVCQEIIDAGIEFRGEGVNDAPSAVSFLKNNWPQTVPTYNGKTCEPNVQLLGSIAHDFGFDAVFCAGDLGAGGSSDMLYDCNTYSMWLVGKMFKKYISVPMFFTDGNHDRWYDISNHSKDTQRCRGCVEWIKWLSSLNTTGRANFPATDNVRYSDGNGNFYPSNTYSVDFPGKKVRVIVRSEYEKQEYVGNASNTGDGPFFKYLNECLTLANPNDADNWTLMSVSHYKHSRTDSYLECFLNGTAHSTGSGSDNFTFTAPNNGNRGKCVVGEIYGHVHPTIVAPTFTGGKLKDTSLLNAGQFIKANLATQRNGSDFYCFSVFVLDDDNFNLHEIKVGYQYNTDSTAYDSTNGIFTFPLRHN